MASKHKPLDLFVIAFILVCLLIGWILKEGIEARTVGFTDTNANISLEYPARWLPKPDPGSLLLVFDPQSRSFFNDRISLQVARWFAQEGMDEFIEHLQTQRGSDYQLYHTISVGPLEIDSLETTRMDYVYAILSPGMDIPNVVRAIDIIFPKGDQVYILTLSADESEFDGNLPEFDAVVSSIRSN
ncbi:MAG: hypothetical protein JXR55_07835 [Candidatus Fermentibacteraceae bacterium]|nr:hypothetical protein [Candidatus Fermentibacteraceae bacterium]